MAKTLEFTSTASTKEPRAKPLRNAAAALEVCGSQNLL